MAVRPAGLARAPCRRAPWRLPRAGLPAALVALALAAGAGCTAAPNASPATSNVAAAVAAAAATQPQDVVDLTLYFRRGRGAAAHLAPVVREVPVSDDLARAAVTLLLAGPVPGDEPGLAAPLPPSTRLRSFRLLGDTAHVDLSHEVVSDAALVGARPEHEALALAALVNTLTEFPTVRRVRVSVEGRSGGDFWGGWGLPRLLLRDESVLAPAHDPPPPPQPGDFSRRPQRIGAEVEPSAVGVRAVRVTPHVGYVRVGVELRGLSGGDAGARVPVSAARRRGGAVVLTVSDVATAALPTGGAAVPAHDPRVGPVTVAAGPLPGALRIQVPAPPGAAFYLHTLSNPTRVVLDVRTSG